MRHTDSMTSNVFCLFAGRFVSLPPVQLMGKLMGATRSIESRIVFFFSILTVLKNLKHAGLNRFIGQYLVVKPVVTAPLLVQALGKEYRIFIKETLITYFFFLRYC